MLPSGGARDTLCGHLGNRPSQRSTALGPQRLDIKHAKQEHFEKHIFSMFSKSPFSRYPLLDAVIYIEIAVNIYANSIKWKEIFTRLLSIALAIVCNEDASFRERFVNMTKLHRLTNLHHHTLLILFSEIHIVIINSIAIVDRVDLHGLSFVFLVSLYMFTQD